MPPIRRRLAGVDGVVLSVLEDGPADGPLVVVLHGFPEDAQSWSRQVEDLAAAGLHAVAPDQRGYGASDRPRGLRAYHVDALADDVLALADGLGRARLHLVGHDWGGVVAWRLAARDPGRVDRLAILNAPHPGAMPAYLLRSPSQALRSAYMAAFQPPGLAEAALTAFDGALLARTLRRSAAPGAFPEAEMRRLQAGWRAPGAMTAMLDWYRALRLAPRPSAFDRVAAPTLILWGARDAFLERGLAQASAGLCDRARETYLEDAGHWLHRERPDRVGVELAAFLAGPDPAAP